MSKPALGGEIVEGRHRLPVRVYYEDTDFSGTIYHGAHVRFFERGRTEFLRAAGVHHFELNEKGLHFAVHKIDITFERRARIDDLLTVETYSSELSGARVRLAQTISRGETVLARANVSVAMVDAHGRPARVPPQVVSAIAPLTV